MTSDEHEIKTLEQLAEEELGFKIQDEIPTETIQETDKDICYTSYLETPEHILEQISLTTSSTSSTRSPLKPKIKYILYNKINGTFEEIDEFSFENKTFRPISNELLYKGAVKLPSGVEEYKDTAEIIADIKEYLFSYFQPPKFYENFLPYYVLFTWVYDNFPFIAYLHFTGLTGTGKTVAAETIANICYKPVDAAGSVTIASIFRLADQWRGTLFLDEFDLSSFGKEGYHAVLTFLKTGVSDRAVLRVEGEKKKEIQSFIVKSPKIFTSENPVSDAGLQSRTFLIKMEKNSKRLPLYKLDNYYKRAEKIRNKLLLWRLRNLNKIDLNDIEFGYEALRKFDGRVQQIVTPIYYLSDENTKKDILDFAQQQEDETFRERRESIEGEVFELICNVYPSNVVFADLLEAVNKERKANPIGQKKLSNIIRKKLNFDIQRKGIDNVHTIIVDSERIGVLKEYYGIHAGERVGEVGGVGEDVAEQYMDEADNEQLAVAQDMFEEKN